jgi:hypothetical protein
MYDIFGAVLKARLAKDRGVSHDATGAATRALLEMNDMA